MTDPSQGDWQKLFREVETLTRRKNHPSIISLLASYTRETDESGHYVKILHLLFPLAEMDLADWMNMSRIPLDIAGFSRQERQKFVYRSMLAVVSGVSYLHQEIDGMVTAHHDLKPRNILMANGKLMIADLGHSHLRPLLQGSATEGASGLGTYEYQPPEYWKDGGERARIKHGRKFDIWAMGCILLELATLVVDDCQTNMVTDFRIQRKANPKKDRQVPKSVQAESDASFHNNISVVRDWTDRLRADNSSPQLFDVLRITAGMLAPEREHRPCAWEVELDLHETLKQFDEAIPNLGRDLCVPPSPNLLLSCGWRGPTMPRHVMIFHRRGKIYDSRLCSSAMGTPFHRAAANGNRKRVLRLWELGWPISLPDPSYDNTVTPQDIMKSSRDITIRELERDSVQLIRCAETGNLEQLSELFSKGLSPLMAGADGETALSRAVSSFNIEVIDLLLQNKAEEQVMLRLKGYEGFPLHRATTLDFEAALQRMLQYYPDINIRDGYGKTALDLAICRHHLDVVRLLLESGAQLLPSEASAIRRSTPLHAAVGEGFLNGLRYHHYGILPERHMTDILKLLLETDDSHRYLETLDHSGSTPLHLAVQLGHLDLFQILLQHGASVNTVGWNGTVLHMIATADRPDFLQSCIEGLSVEDFDLCWKSRTPLEIAQKKGHKRVAQLMKKRIGELRGSAGDDSGS